MRYATSHTLIAWAMSQGHLRWDSGTRELCYNGIRHSTKLDGLSIPILSEDLQEQLLAHWSRST